MKLILLPLLLLCDVISGSVVSFEKPQSVWQESDRITQLPDVIEMPDAPMYSGYLDNNITHLFYWLVESSNHDSNKLMLWFNGGPGCSSMEGLFNENGPFKFNHVTGQLVHNPFSWNRLANVLYLEAPVGVGFSYSDTPNVELSDDATAEINYKSLKIFLKKFPKFANMDIYITGESYGGIYIPTLMNHIRREDSDLTEKIKGLFIGNGMMNYKIISDNLVPYAFYHGFISPKLWKKYKESCQRNNLDCLMARAEVDHEVRNQDLNIYNFARDCENSEEQDEDVTKFAKWHMGMKFSGLPGNLQMEPDCLNSSLMTGYLNREDVRSAIHIRSASGGPEGRWSLCRAQVFNSYARTYYDMTFTINELMHNLPNLKILLYYGDFDLVCNFLGAEVFVDQLGLQITKPRDQWTLPRGGNQQIGGYFKEYQNLTFATVKGAGHEVPTDKPEEIFHLIQMVLDRAL